MMQRIETDTALKQDETISVDFTGVTEPVDRTRPGVDIFTVSGTEVGIASTGTSFLYITFVNDKSTFRERFFLSKEALPRLKHLLTGLGVTQNEINKLTSTTDISDIITGRTVRLLVGAEEVTAPTGTTTWARLGFSRFAESVNVNPTQLVFDPRYHIQKRKTPALSGELTDGTFDTDTTNTNLPF